MSSRTDECASVRTAARRSCMARISRETGSKAQREARPGLLRQTNVFFTLIGHVSPRRWGAYDGVHRDDSSMLSKPSGAFNRGQRQRTEHRRSGDHALPRMGILPQTDRTAPVRDGARESSRQRLPRSETEAQGRTLKRASSLKVRFLGRFSTSDASKDNSVRISRRIVSIRCSSAAMTVNQRLNSWSRR